MQQPLIERIILFDGECILCNKAVLLLIKRDPNKLFLFASLQSPYGESLLRKIGINSKTLNSIILVHGNDYFIKSRAVLEILKELEGYSILNRLLKIFPTSILDIFYDIIAKIRYKLFGKTKICVIYDQGEFTQRIAK